tara:strand:- start:766 stop:1707 length:942 start_codon:yes stop_codon:yes gene_type:complete
MKNNQNLTDMLDEISFDQAIFSNKLYRKISNLDNTYSVYELNFKNNCFIWEKIPNFKLSEGYECILFNNLVYVKENNSHITIYNTQDNLATKLMIYTGNNTLIWDILNIPIDINNLNTHSLLNLPTYVNLSDEYSNEESPEECQMETYDLVDEFEPITTEPIKSENIQFEPLHGWDNLLERSSDTEEKIVLDNDLENDIEIKDNFVYPDDESHTDMKVNLNDDADDGVDDVDDSDDQYSDEYYDEEYRVDPYNGRWYSHSEFIDYYGGEIEWDFMENKKFLLREEYYKFTNTFCHLSDKKFMFLFNEFQKTYE